MFDLQQESAAFAAREDIDWGALDGKRILVTGATGLIGSHCARALLERNRLTDAGIRIVALVRNIDKARACFEGYTHGDGLTFVEGDLAGLGALVSPDTAAAGGAVGGAVGGADAPALDELSEVDLVIHAACPTASSFFVNHPVDTAKTIVGGTLALLDIARANDARLVYLSSMEVYGKGNPEPGLDHLLGEADVGYVDPLSPRSCYPEAKRMAEHFCCAYAAQFGVHAGIVRLAQTFGPGIPKTDTRIFAQLARCAIEGRDIVLKTTGTSTRMYNYTTDAVAGIFTVLAKGKAGCAYNVANPATYSSICEMAEMVCEQCADGRIATIIEVDPDAPYPPDHHLPLDTSALQELGWEPQVGLPEMYDRLIEYLRE